MRNLTDLIDNILPIFRHPMIASFRRKEEISEKKLNEYARHIDNIRRYFDAEISDEEVRHYLHVLMFDRMIFRSLECKTKDSDTLESIKGIKRKEDLNETMRNEAFAASPKRSKSLPSLTSKLTPELHFLSDGNIDYGKIVPDIVECSPLFDLIDPRELLVPGYLEKNVFKTRVLDRARLEDFSDVELLSEAIFLQFLYECLLAFDRVDLRYFEPTDSLLLCFCNKWKINGVSTEERMSSIRTPVRLRDFCKYVVPEEKDWLRREEELYRLQTAKSMERLMRKSAEIYEETMLFRDEDFILPGTLKAKDSEASRDLDRQKSSLDVGKRTFYPCDSISRSSLIQSSFVDVSPLTPVEEMTNAAKKRKKSPKEGKKRNDKSSSRRISSKKSIADEISPLITGKVSLAPPDTEREPVYDFVGYDLERLRVQVTNRKKTFYSADDTLVQVEIDDWLYKSKNLRITVTLHGYSLRLFHRIDGPETNEIFHVTSRIGIILAFQKMLASSLFDKFALDASKNRFHTWQDMNVEQRISWPTGLLIEPIIGDGPDNPYYIKQSYIPKGYVNPEGDREICRRFLRNGTVLKYLDDGRVTVLRPNGVIVNCIAFEELQVERHENYDEQVNFPKNGSGICNFCELRRALKMYPYSTFKGDRPKEPKVLSKIKRKPMTGFKSRLLEADEVDSVSAQQNLTMDRDDVLSTMGNTVKVSRYTVLNDDGGLYEVLDDLIVSEQHRLLVRIASDYEVDEKFTRRADGTNMLLNSNGELIVRYPGTFQRICHFVGRVPISARYYISFNEIDTSKSDKTFEKLHGTRITIGYTIEKEPVMCDWTEEEILLYFVSDGIKEDEQQHYIDPSLSNLKYVDEASLPKVNADYQKKINELLIRDSFVSVLLTCRMEHKNYATVFYDQSAVNCTLSMPDDLRVSISRRGHYEVSMADGVNLKVIKTC
ncbi:uncharacterized protein LOC126917508 [Bombus affinis]|uniref:uncharacterized protein LOC126917508 n=1 Tax=Bombus affinis TaxID=309941 RepID=UPI0021B78D1E|nr:uncharacterized protein LOC126917508 [Bombus affinis]